MKRITMEHPFNLLLLLLFSLLLVFSFALITTLGNEHVQLIGWVIMCITVLTIIFSIVVKNKKWPYRKYQVVCLDIDDNYQYFVILSDYTKNSLEKYLVKYININYTGIVLKELVLVKEVSDETDI